MHLSSMGTFVACAHAAGIQSVKQAHVQSRPCRQAGRRAKGWAAGKQAGARWCSSGRLCCSCKASLELAAGAVWLSHNAR